MRDRGEHDRPGSFEEAPSNSGSKSSEPSAVLKRLRLLTLFLSPHLTSSDASLPPTPPSISAAMAVPSQYLAEAFRLSSLGSEALSSTSSSGSEIDSREHSPELVDSTGFAHVVDGEERTTRQRKDWRGPSHIHKKTFWEVSSSWHADLLFRIAPRPIAELTLATLPTAHLE